jgi:hypothetical protein
VVRGAALLPIRAARGRDEYRLWLIELKIEAGSYRAGQIFTSNLVATISPTTRSTSPISLVRCRSRRRECGRAAAIRM